jgi:uncharacterized protein YbjT (DUF2867 family)
MKVLIIGGTGRIGTNVGDRLRALGHDVTPAAPSTGVDTITGEGLAAAVAGADVVLDVSNAPAWEDQAVLDFFTTSTGNILAAEKAAGVKHHVALTIVGADRAPDSGYLRAKVAQERLIEESGQPYTIVRSTQFFEFVRGIAEGGADGDFVRLPSATLQPIAADDVARLVAEFVVAPPIDGAVEIAGPDAIPLDELGRHALEHHGDHRKVIADPAATYFGTRLEDSTLTPQGAAHLGDIRFDEWLASSPV